MHVYKIATDRRTETDGRTPHRYLDPASHAMWAVAIAIYSTSAYITCKPPVVSAEE